MRRYRRLAFFGEVMNLSETWNGDEQASRAASCSSPSQKIRYVSVSLSIQRLISSPNSMIVVLLGRYLYTLGVAVRASQDQLQVRNECIC